MRPPATSPPAEVAPVARRTRSAFLPISAHTSLFTPTPSKPMPPRSSRVSPLSLTFPYTSGAPAILTPNLTPEPSFGESPFREKERKRGPSQRVSHRPLLTPSCSDVGDELLLASSSSSSSSAVSRPQRQARSRSASLVIITPPSSSEPPRRSPESQVISSPVSPTQRPTRRRSRACSAAQSPSSSSSSSSSLTITLKEELATMRVPSSEENTRGLRSRARAEGRRGSSTQPAAILPPSASSPPAKAGLVPQQPEYSFPVTRRRASMAAQGKAQEGADQQAPWRSASSKPRELEESDEEVDRSGEEKEEEEGGEDGEDGEDGEEGEEGEEGEGEPEEEEVDEQGFSLVHQLPLSPMRLRSRSVPKESLQEPQLQPLVEQQPRGRASQQVPEVISLISDSEESASDRPRRRRRHTYNYTSDDDLGEEDCSSIETETEIEDDLFEGPHHAKKRTWSQRSSEPEDHLSSPADQKKRLPRGYSCNLSAEEQRIPKPQLVTPERPFQPCLYPPSGSQKECMDELERDIWGWSIKREVDYLPSPDCREIQPNFAQSFRNILVDWMFEVSMDFKLHRETTHLAINYVDRFLSKSSSLPKSQYQLIGITALFIAAKLEEIYPPKVSYFSDVTDGLFSIKDIHAMELSMLKTLKWKLVVPTLNYWTNFFLQNAARVTGPSCDEAILKTTKDLKHFFGPKFMVEKYLRVMGLLDAATHSFESLQFPYSLLAATAVSLVLIDSDDKNLVFKASGFSKEQLEACSRWLAPLSSYPGVSEFRKRPAVPSVDWFNFQTHNEQLLPFLNRRR